MITIQAPTIVNQLLPGHAGRGRNGHKPLIIVMHQQAGNGNPFNYFKSLGVSGANAADCTIWNPSADNASLVRYLYDTDTAWTNGSWTEPINHNNPVLEGLFNAGIYSGDVSLTVENEGFGTFTDAQYTRLAQLVAWWSQQYNIPIDRNHIVGHSEIGPHKQCPGPNFDYARLIKMATETPSSNVRYFPETGFSVVGDFLKFFNSNGGIPIFGLPVTPEMDAKDYSLPYKGSCQWFERSRLEFHDDSKSVMLGRVGAELLAKG